MNKEKRFLDSLERKAKIFAPSVKKVAQEHEELFGWLLSPLAEWALRAYGEDIFDVAAKGYAEYCLNVSMAQRRYEQTGVFANRELSEVKSEIYSDDDYMDPYMWAAILIYGFWPSMINHVRLYRDEFVQVLKPGTTILELASGHGVMGLLAAHHRPEIAVQGYDISPPAVAIAQKLTSAAQLGERVNFEVKDALDLDVAGEAGSYHGIIAAMLAEHLSDPIPLFRIIAHHLAPEGIAFFSTAIESAQPDHVYEFNNESEAIVMAEEQGLRVTRLVCDGNDSKDNLKYKPRAMALILTHR